jgi:hypothetical protein
MTYIAAVVESKAFRLGIGRQMDGSFHLREIYKAKSSPTDKC